LVDFHNAVKKERERNQLLVTEALGRPNHKANETPALFRRRPTLLFPVVVKFSKISVTGTLKRNAKMLFNQFYLVHSCFNVLCKVMIILLLVLI